MSTILFIHTSSSALAIELGRGGRRTCRAYKLHVLPRHLSSFVDVHACKYRLPLQNDDVWHRYLRNTTACMQSALEPRSHRLSSLWLLTLLPWKICTDSILIHRLACTAFHTVFAPKQTRFGELIVWLEKQLRLPVMGRMGREEKRMLVEAVEKT